jgi:hypothetical protein
LPPLFALADAILGVNFFSSIAPLEFLKFDRAFVCMFRIAAGETWVGDLPVVDDNGSLNVSIALFIFSFVLIVNWTLLQASFSFPLRPTHGSCPVISLVALGLV